MSLLNYVDILNESYWSISLVHYINNLIQNPNFGSFVIFSNLINNRIKLHMEIYGSLDLYKFYGFKLVVICN